MAQQTDLVFVTYIEAPRRAARNQVVKELVRKQALKAYYSPQGSDRMEERRRESAALDKQYRRKHMNRFRIRRDHELEKDDSSAKVASLEPILSRKVYAFEPYVSSLGPGAWELLDYFRECFRMKSMSIHSDKEWFNFALSESSMAQATLCLASLNRDFARGGAVSSITLHHRAAAMEQLRKEIDDTNVVGRETVAGTVAILAIAEDMEGNFSNSSAHFDGMAQIAKACGGLRWLSGERACMILKVIAWADLCHAAAWLSKPRLLGWFDNAVSLDGQRIFSISNDHSSRLCNPIFRLELERLTCPHLRSMIDILHHFPLPTTMEELSKAEQTHLTRLLYMTEQMVQQLKKRIPFEGSIPALSRAFVAAIQLYVPKMLRRMPLPPEAASLLTEDILKEVRGHQIRADPEDGCSPRNSLILWTQANALAALKEEADGRAKLARDFQETLSILEIFSKEDLIDQLSCIAWSAPTVDESLVGLVSDMYLLSHESKI